MNPNAVQEIVSLSFERREMIEVDGPDGTSVRVTHGEVWITCHHDTQDHLLRAGDVLVHRGPGKTLVSALKQACVEIRLPRVEGGAWSALAGAILRFRGGARWRGRSASAPLPTV